MGAAEEALELRRQRGPRTVLQGLISTGPRRMTEAEKALAMRDRQKQGVNDVDFAAHFVNQDTIEGEALGANERFMLGLLGDTFEEREAQFLSSNPAGEMVEVPTTDITLFRKDPTEKFRRVDRPFFESIAEGGILKETGRDVAEIAGATGPEIAGEAVSLTVGKRPGGGRLLRDALRLFLGGTGGEATQQVAQEIAGTQREALTEQAERAVTEGGISVIGGTVGAGIGATKNLATGRALFKITPEGERAIAAAGRLGVDEPLPIQIVDSPFLRLLGRQAQALLPRINRALRAQQEALRSILRGASDRKARAKILETATRAFDQAERHLKSLILGASREGKRVYRQASLGLQDTVTKWWRISGDVVDDLYAHSRAIEEPSFDLSPALRAADEVATGVRAPGIPRNVLNEAGEIVGEEIPEIQLRSLETVLNKEIRNLRAIDPTLPRREGFATPLETLRQIRANLRDLTLPGPEGMRQHNVLAIKLRDAVEEVIENASHESPEAVAAYKKAQRAAARRFATREQAAVVDLLNTETPSRYARSLIQPNSVDNLIALSRAGGKEVLEEIQDLFISDLARDPRNITKTLASFDEPTLNLLLPRDKRVIVEGAARQVDELFASNIPKARARQNRVRGFIKDLFDTSATKEIDNLAILMNKTGGREGPFGKSLRAAILDEIWQRSQVVLESASGLGAGFRKIDAKRLNAVLDDFNERGLLQFLTLSEKKLVRNVELVQRVADVLSPDAGTSLQAASAVAGARSLSVQALQTFAENFGVGKIMVGERGRDLLIGTATGRKRPSDTVIFKLIGAISSSLLNDIENEKDLPEELESRQ